MPDKQDELTEEAFDAALRVAYRTHVIEPAEAGADAAQIAAGRERFDQIAAGYLISYFGAGWAPKLTAVLVAALDRDWARARAGDATPPPLLIDTGYSQTFPSPLG